MTICSTSHKERNSNFCNLKLNSQWVSFLIYQDGKNSNIWEHTQLMRLWENRPSMPHFKNKGKIKMSIICLFLQKRNTNMNQKQMQMVTKKEWMGQPRQRRHVAGAGRGCGSGPSSINPLGIWFLSTTPHHPGGPSASAHGHPDTELQRWTPLKEGVGWCLSDLSTPGSSWTTGTLPSLPASLP